eukprot:g33648.t1
MKGGSDTDDTGNYPLLSEDRFIRRDSVGVIYFERTPSIHGVVIAPEDSGFGEKPSSSTKTFWNGALVQTKII